MDWATLIAAIVAGFVAFLALVATRRASARDNAILRFETAIAHIESGVDYRVEFGQQLLGQLRTGAWLSDADRLLAARTLQAYNRARSEPEGG